MNLETAILPYLTDSEALKNLKDLGVKPEMIRSPDINGAYEWAIEYWADNAFKAAPSIDYISHQFPNLDFRPNPDSYVDIPHLAEDLRERHKVNSLNDAIVRVSTDPALKNDITSQLEFIGQQIDTIKHQSRPTNMVVSFTGELGEWFEKYPDRLTSDEFKGVPLGLPEIDEYTCGVRKGELCIISAPVKTGKTQLLILAALAAVREGYRVVFFSFEMYPSELVDRAISFLTEFDMGAVNRGHLTREQIDEAREVLERFKQGHEDRFLITTLGEERRSVDNILAVTKEFDADVIIIDQLVNMESAKSNSKANWERYEDIVYSLKRKISDPTRKRYPVIVAHQVNRQGMDSKKKLAQHMAGTSAVERAADILYVLEQNDAMRMNNSAVLRIIATRRMAPKAWMLDWRLQDRTAISVKGEYEDPDE